MACAPQILEHTGTDDISLLKQPSQRMQLAAQNATTADLATSNANSEITGIGIVQTGSISPNNNGVCSICQYIKLVQARPDSRTGCQAHAAWESQH